MVTCELCKQSSNDLSLREATHKVYGRKWVCQDCWTELYTRNEMISGSTGSGTVGCSMGCPGCKKA